VKYFALQNDEYALEAPTQLGVDVPQNDTNYEIYFGEVVRNLRTILRRRNLWRATPIDVDTDANLIVSQCALNRLPSLPGYDPNGIDLARNQANNANVRYNWVYNTPYHWFAGCYLGCRGAVNYYYDTVRDDTRLQVYLTNAQRFPRQVTIGDAQTGQVFLDGGSTFDRLKRFYVTSLPNTNPGICETSVNTSESLAVQFPYYSRFRMRQCSPDAAVLGSSLDDSNIDNTIVSVVSKRSNIANRSLSSHLKIYFGIGTDFSFLFFLNVPLLYVYADPAAPT
jgi:hypothetical protein